MAVRYRSALEALNDYMWLKKVVLSALFVKQIKIQNINYIRMRRKIIDDLGCNI